MSTPALYTDGTITVTEGSTTLVGHGTAWSTQLRRGTIISVAGQPVSWPVASIGDDATGEFFLPWPGETAVEVAYVAQTFTGGAEFAEGFKLLLERLIGRGMGVVVAGEPKASDLRDNDIGISRLTGLPYYKDMGVVRSLFAPGSYNQYGHTDTDPSERDQYDEEAAGFTFFAINETGFYILLTPAEGEDPAEWSDLVLVRGADGREVEIAASETHLRWRYAGDDGWTNLVALADLRGAAGASAGIPLTFSTSTATNEDPGAGLIRFNHATPASATEVAIDDLSSTGAAIAALIARWGAPTSAVKGKLLVQDAELEAFVEFEVTGLSDEDGWTRLTVANGIGSGAFSGAAAVVATFIPSGEKGDVGRAGIPYLFDEATEIADPGAGKFRIGTLVEGVGQLAISKLDANGASRNAELMPLIASSTLTVRNPESNAYRAFHVTADPDGSGGDFIAVEVEAVGSAGSFAANDKLDLAYAKVGNDGFLPGHRFSFATATADEDPGAGRLRFDSATFAEIAWLYVDHLDLAGSDVQDWLANLSSDTAANNRGTLLLTAATDPDTFREFVVVGDVVAATGYHKVPVAPIAEAGDFDDELTVVETFTKRGTDGLDGNDPGYRFVFDDATGETEPAAGRIRFNHATFASITKLIVSNRLAEAGTPDIGGAIAGWGGSTNPGNKGRILIKKIGSPEVQATLRIVDAVTSHSGDWFEVPVEPVAIAGAFSADDALSLEETRTGNSAVVENAVETVLGIAPVEGDVSFDASHVPFVPPETEIVSETVEGAILENEAAIASVAGSLEDHEGDQNNPHNVTKTQVGLGNVTDAAQLTRGAGDWSGFATKDAIHDNDAFLSEDSEASGAKKRNLWSAIKARLLAVTSFAKTDVEDQTLTGGARVTSKSLGTVTTGTLTPDPGDRPMQHCTNGGAFALAPGSNPGSYTLDIVNNGSAGNITTSSWTFVTGDAFSTTNGHKFRCNCTIGENGSTLEILAMQ